jgi:hypothetical protein
MIKSLSLASMSYFPAEVSGAWSRASIIKIDNLAMPWHAPVLVYLSPGKTMPDFSIFKGTRA